MIISKLGINIKKHRELKGWSMNELSKRAGVGYATIHGIESGKTKMLNVESLDKISKVLNVKSFDLVSGDIENNKGGNLEESFVEVLRNSKLELDGVKLSKYEKDFIEEYIDFSIKQIKKMRSLKKDGGNEDG